MASTTWQDGWRRLLRRVDTTGERVTDGFPHYGDPATGRCNSHGCYNQRINLATRHEPIWGSYYLFEALHVPSGALPPSRI